MDKVLAFSILSASSADIAAGSWARLSWRGRKQDDQAGRGQQGDEPAEAKQKQQRGNGNSQSQHREKPSHGEVLRPRFAPEFDGIDCFETIVSH